MTAAPAFISKYLQTPARSLQQARRDLPIKDQLDRLTGDVEDAHDWAYDLQDDVLQAEGRTASDYVDEARNLLDEAMSKLKAAKREMS